MPTIREIAVALAATLAMGLATAQPVRGATPDSVAATSFAQRSAAPAAEAEAAQHSAAGGREAVVSPDLLAMSPVPEPGVYAMLAAGLGVVVFVSRRRRRQD